MMEIFYCECGSDVMTRPGGIKVHMRTKKHQEYLKLKELTRDLSNLSITRDAK